MSESMFFISGPMTGYDEYNYPAFHEVGGFLESKGVAFRSPAHDSKGKPVEPPESEEAQSWECYMRESIKLLMDCDSILMLPGWENSRGATIEKELAIILDMPIEYRMERRK